MGKFLNLQSDAFSIFNSDSWKAENIKTFPSDFVTLNPGNEFIRVTIIPSGAGINLNSVSGLFLIDIFTIAGNGPKRSFTIADKLDQYLVGKSINTALQRVTQFNNSSLDFRGLDKDNPTLSRSVYSIPFNYFEVN